MKLQPFLSFLMIALFTSASVAQNDPLPGEMARKPVRVLLVVAHPDDEYEVASTVYRISKELFGTVAQVIITDGEAGYRYSSLAEAEALFAAMAARPERARKIGIAESAEPQ